MAKQLQTADRKHAPEVLRALRRLDGRATVGDIMAATGLARADAEHSLRDLLNSRRGHLEVGQAGDLVYAFEPRLVERDHVPWWSRLGRSLRRFLAAAFKAWIVTMLVVYFVVFVVLIVAAVVAAISGDRRGRGRGMRVRVPSFWIWYVFWTRGWRFGRPYYGHRWEQRQAGQVPFYKKVFAYVFGPDRPAASQAERDRRLVELIRSREGVLTATELVEYTGVPLVQAEEEMARLMAAYEGDVRVSEKGDLVYVFAELMLSAHGRVRVRRPEPAWRRLERPLEPTGNTAGQDALITGLNGFNLVASLSAPWLIFPRLGLGGPIAWTGLVFVPLGFSALFWAVPLVRRAALRRQNADRLRRNVRKLLLGRVFAASVNGEPVAEGPAAAALRAELKGDSPGDPLVAAELGRIATEFEARTEAADGGLRFWFGSVRETLAAAALARSEEALETRRIGEIVFSSGDTATQESRRALADFDAELRRGLPGAGAAWLEEFEGDESDERSG